VRTAQFTVRDDFGGASQSIGILINGIGTCNIRGKCVTAENQPYDAVN
jgi:hypothetical protein